MRSSCILLAGLALGLGAVSSTAIAQDQHHRIVGAQVDVASVKAVRVGEHIRIEKFQTPLGEVDLELDRVELFADNPILELGTADGMKELEVPELVVLRGIVAGDADSLAYIALSPFGTNGFIRQGDEIITISTGPYAQGKDLSRALRAARVQDVVDPNARPDVPPSACGVEMGMDQLVRIGLPEPERIDDTQDPRGDNGADSCRIASIAIETDWEYNDRLFDGNSTAAASYAMSLIGAISEIYERDFNTRLAISYLRIWEDDADPYEDPLSGPCFQLPPNDPLFQLRDYWNANMQHIDRSTTHLLSGRVGLCYGGVAYVGALCNGAFGYGVSAYLDGFFPYPLIDFSSANWDLIVVSHELGHNFGTGHTHDLDWYNPTIDDCGGGDCSSPFGGTIMSYCHTCPGGLTNMQLHFHPRIIETVNNYLDNISCDLVSVGVTAADDLSQTLEDTPVNIDAMGNDAAQSCDPFVLDYVDSVSLNGGTVQRLAGQGANGRDIFRYTPPLGFVGVDSFEYSIAGDQGLQHALVSVNVRTLRDAEPLDNPVPGLKLAYYEIDEMTRSLPNFDEIDPYLEEVSDNLSYPVTFDTFVNSGRSDLVATLFQGYFYAEVEGEYSFWTESSDGSRLYIGDELVVDNDGLHGMVKRGGSIPLRAGYHSMRVEFFEYFNETGLFVTVSKPGTPAQALRGELIAHAPPPPCSIADINADQVLNFFDVAQYLEAYNAGNLGVADLNGDDRLNFFDVSAFLIAFEEGCP